MHELKSEKPATCISILITNDGKLFSHTRGEKITLWSREDDGTWTSSASLNAPGNEYCGAQLINIGSSSSTAIIYPAGDGSNLLVASPQNNKVLFNIPVDKTLGNVMELKSAGPDLIMALFETGSVLLWDARNYNKPHSFLSLVISRPVLANLLNWYKNF